jgi:outer membrane immunogenic protein
MLEPDGEQESVVPGGPMNRAKLAMLAGTSLCLSFGAAYAADMPVKARVAPVAITDPWVGFYAGGNIGYSFGRTHDTAEVGPLSFDDLNRFGSFLFPGGADATSSKVNGVIGGGQAGFVGRIAPHWLAGIEADIQWSGEKGTAHGVFGGNTRDCTTGECSFANATDITKKLNYFGTFRFRTGYEVNGIWIYGTAGLAYGEVSVSGNNVLTLLDNSGRVGAPNGVMGIIGTPFHLSQFQVGYSAGLGIEGLIAATNWRWKAEWLHIDLGSTDGGLFGGMLIRGTRFTDEIVRIGFNYHFDCDSSIVAKY